MRYRSWAALLIALATLAASLSSCSNLNEKAKEYFEAGAYEEALHVYDQVLESSPTDTEATIGRMRSREKLIDTKLIEVRRSRMAGNQKNSIDMLLKIVEEENEWGTYPKGAVAFTQDEEALKYLVRKVKSSLKLKFPMRARALLKQYEAIFQGNHLPRFQKLFGDVRNAGKTECQRFSSTAGDSTPYYAEFVNRLCASWGAKVRGIASTGNRKYAELYKKIKFIAHINGLPAVAVVPSHASDGTLRGEIPT